MSERDFPEVLVVGRGGRLMSIVSGGKGNRDVRQITLEV